MQVKGPSSFRQRNRNSPLSWQLTIRGSGYPDSTDINSAGVEADAHQFPIFIESSSTTYRSETMLAEPMPLLRKRRLLLTTSVVEGDTISATVVPQKASDTEGNALTTHWQSPAQARSSIGPSSCW